MESIVQSDQRRGTNTSRPPKSIPFGPGPEFYRSAEIKLCEGCNVVVRNEPLRRWNPSGVTGFLKQWRGWLNRDLSVVPCKGFRVAEEVKTSLQEIGLQPEKDFCILVIQSGNGEGGQKIRVPWLDYAGPNGSGCFVRHR